MPRRAKIGMGKELNRGEPVKGGRGEKTEGHKALKQDKKKLCEREAHKNILVLFFAPKTLRKIPFRFESNFLKACPN